MHLLKLRKYHSLSKDIAQKNYIYSYVENMKMCSGGFKTWWFSIDKVAENSPRSIPLKLNSPAVPEGTYYADAIFNQSNFHHK